jgi:hypothetical protein
MNDANDMTAALGGLGFTVDTLVNGGRVQMEEAIERFKNRLSVARNSYGFLFYAGHGVQSGGINYLIPVDADIRSESYLGDRAVSVQAMLDEINRAGNELNIVVLDACRDNPFSWGRNGIRGLQVVGNQPADSGSAQGRRERITLRIMLGDWIDLPRLSVQGDAGGGDNNTDNVDLGANGKLLRLIVVGIDSFAGTNKDAPAHVVFQFQNVPGYYRMNASNTNAGGYKRSEMHRYLTGSFLQGLLSAGVPEGALYAPTRHIANGGEKAAAADALADRLWLPTEREAFGENKWSNKTWETAANQARLESYGSNSRRQKYTATGSRWWWWEASPAAGSAAHFCRGGYGGGANGHLASVVGGCAPVFCVR